MGKDTQEDLKDSEVIVSLCSSDDFEMQKWMQSIRDFHDCQVKEGPAGDKTNPNLRVTMDQDIIIEKEREQKDQEEIKLLDDGLDQVEDMVADNVSKLKLQATKFKRQVQEEDDNIEVLQEKEECLSQNIIEEAKKSELENEKVQAQKFKDKFKNINILKKLQDLDKDRMDRVIQEEDT